MVTVLLITGYADHRTKSCTKLDMASYESIMKSLKAKTFLKI